MSNNENQFNLSRFLPLIRVITILIVLLIAFKVALYLLPFVFSIIVVTITAPIRKFLIEKLNIKNTIAGKLVVTIFYLVIAFIIFRLFSILINEAYLFFNTFNINSSQIKDSIHQITEKYLSLEGNINRLVFNSIQNGAELLINTITNKGLNYINYLLNSTLQLPVYFVYIVITITSTYMMVNNIEKVNNFFKEQFPKSWISKFIEIRKDVLDVIFSYLKAQSILIFLSFIELLIGFTLINLFISKIQYILLLAVLVAMIDALPILGTGTILIPWALYSMSISNYNLGISLLILYLIIFILRVILEPKILTKNLSVDPLLSLISMYVGFKFFGIIGFLAGPIMMTILRVIFNEEIKNGFFKILAGEE